MRDFIRFFGCLGVSAAIHAAFFISLPHNVPAQALLAQRPLEVSYQQAATNKKAALPPRSSKIAPVKMEKLPLAPNKMASDLIKNEIFNDKQTLEIANKALPKDDASLLKKSVSLTDIPGETFKTPEYKNYSSMIREKIRRLAYYYYNINQKAEEGEIVGIFSLTSKGELVSISINEEQSSRSATLREITLKSVREAAPFSEFPEKLNKNEKLSFGLTITFVIKHRGGD